ncbi:MAG: peptidoglycan-binding protein [Actinomycetota bacterium]
MSGNDRRESLVLGIFLGACFFLILVALGGLRDSVPLAVIRPATAWAGPQSDVAASFVDAPDDLDSTVTPEPCSLSGVPLAYGSFGDDVFCLQDALVETGHLDGPADGLFGEATVLAVTTFQTQQGLRADGIVGRPTGSALGIWPPDPPAVVRTPTPAPGATDLWGLPLSSVAVSGPDAPPLPPNSGTGYRLVYDRAAQRVWAVDDDETVIRSWLVSGSRNDNEVPGIHIVYSRSGISESLDGASSFRFMVRWLDTGDDAIGFHSLPRRTFDGSPYQSEDELGVPQSGGCQRQADLDAEFTWKFAPRGTIVVVI